ncbi:MAG: phosphopentomutase [Acidobacteria bacterium]|nr:phosphopentomutase [Acidobacteriota bacterium]
MTGPLAFDRVILLVCDSMGIGEMPDAGRFGDEGSDTLGHVLEHRRVSVPNLRSLGLANIRPLPILPSEAPLGAFGKAATASDGKDTTIGHWEMAGIVTAKAFPTYPEGFPAEIISRFESAIGRKTLGNYPASGTEIIKQLGEEHVRTGFPIVYTSADSVFQIAAHEEVIPLEELYKYCRIARGILTGPHEVGRVIARPFRGETGGFCRTEARVDFAVEPPSPTLLDRLSERNLASVCVGKISSIFNYRGVSRKIEAKNNAASIDGTLQAMRESGRGLIFVNLVDFDMLYGHRNDVEGYARALEYFDERLPEIESTMEPGDLLMISADHGCDPVTPSTDHSREYVPVLAWGRRLRPNTDLGTRSSLADIGQTIAENFGFRLDAGRSFLREILP